jgi:hypothetical protein
MSTRMTTQHNMLRIAAAALIALQGCALSACSGGASSVPKPAVTNCGTAQTSSTARHTRDEQTDSPAWVPAASTASSEQYADDGSRLATRFDTDVVKSGGKGPVVSSTCNASQSDGRSAQSSVLIPTQCWFQAVQPGVHNPQTDIFLGCDYAIFDTGSFMGFGGNKGNAKGVVQGPPQDGAQCQSSPTTVGDTVSPGNGYFTDVVDINAIWNGNKVAGWVYLGSDGKEYFQLNFANEAGRSLGVTWGVFSVGITPPSGYSGYYPYDPSMLTTTGMPFDPRNALFGAKVVKCFKGGKQL